MSTIGGGVNIVTDGLVLYLDAANTKSYPGSGTVWTDVSRTGANGTLVNGPTFNSGNGGSIVFDGTNDYVTLSRPSQLVTGGQITICLYARWTTVGTTTSTIQELISNNHSSSPNQGFSIEDRPDLSKSLTFQTNWGVGSSFVQSTFQVGDGNWHFICGTNDGTTSKLYIDGILNNQAASAGLAPVQSNIGIGYWSFQNIRFLNGRIPQVQIYNRALTAQEVRQNYNATKNRFGL